MTAQLIQNLKKFDEEEQIVWAEVYVPDFPDSQGDFASAEVIKKLAYGFMKSGQLDMIDINHDNKTYGCHVVESFIAREGDDVFIAGAWVVAVHAPDPVIWEMIKDGTLNGFSMEVAGYSQSAELELDIPKEIIGKTSEVDGHSHKFTVRFGEDGEFLGGETDLVDGHRHAIYKGTLTEVAKGHTHTFSFIEEILK